VNILRGRFLPWPMMTWPIAPDAMWPFSVLMEMRSLRAASAGVCSKASGGGASGLRCRRGKSAFGNLPFSDLESRFPTVGNSDSSAVAGMG
jgi:hypothetical protein